jgi:hypothetical protein
MSVVTGQAGGADEMRGPWHGVVICLGIGCGGDGPACVFFSGRRFACFTAMRRGLGGLRGGVRPRQAYRTRRLVRCDPSRQPTYAGTVPATVERCAMNVRTTWWSRKDTAGIGRRPPAARHQARPCFFVGERSFICRMHMALMAVRLRRRSATRDQIERPLERMEPARLGSCLMMPGGARLGVLKMLQTLGFGIAFLLLGSGIWANLPTTGSLSHVTGAWITHANR